MCNGAAGSPECVSMCVLVYGMDQGFEVGEVEALIPFSLAVASMLCLRRVSEPFGLWVAIGIRSVPCCLSLLLSLD